MKKRPDPPQHGNLIAMIDVVFQLVIFFVCTTKMQDSALDDGIKLAMAPHGIALEQKDPLEIQVAVDKDGTVSIARTRVSDGQLVSILTKARIEARGQVPVVIRGSEQTKHSDIKRVMDSCVRAGIWKIKFAALKEKA